jgi:hypothetical protein
VSSKEKVEKKERKAKCGPTGMGICGEWRIG